MSWQKDPTQLKICSDDNNNNKTLLPYTSFIKEIYFDRLYSFYRLKYHHDENSDNEDDIGPNITDLGPVDYPPGEHKLQHAYCLWFSRRPSQIQGTNLRVRI